MEVSPIFLKNKQIMTREAKLRKGQNPNATWMFTQGDNAKNVFLEIDPMTEKRAEGLAWGIVDYMGKKWTNEKQIGYALGLIESFATKARELVGMPPLKPIEPSFSDLFRR